MSKSKKTQGTEAKAKKAERKREPKEKVELRTVAVRVSESEFKLLHDAAGPRNLSNFLRTTILAAANRTVAK